ncbi:MAG: hypothetical protein JXA37_04445 [Chloroflexia bacterium]|nr:hypothetical protein [Chloroflexia bacterium]
MSVPIGPNQSIRALAAAILRRAIRDVRKGEEEQAAALVFLGGEWCALLLDALELTHLEPVLLDYARWREPAPPAIARPANLTK